jgi:hypothetical protein
MPSDSSSGDGFIGFLKRFIEWVGIIATVVAALFAVQKIFDTATSNISWSVLSAVGLGWLFCYWVYRSKTKREVWMGIDQQQKIEKVPQLRIPVIVNAKSGRS